MFEIHVLRTNEARFLAESTLSPPATFNCTRLMVVVLGSIYEYNLSHEDAGKLIKQIFGAVGWTWGASVLGMKFFAEILKGAGVVTLGGATFAGMALDATLSGSVTYALGYTTKDYLAKGKKMSTSELEKVFKAKFSEGKQRIKDQPH